MAAHTVLAFIFILFEDWLFLAALIRLSVPALSSDTFPVFPCLSSLSPFISLDLWHMRAEAWLLSGKKQ